MNTRSWKIIMLIVLIIVIVFINYKAYNDNGNGSLLEIGTLVLDLFVLISLIVNGPKTIYRNFFT